MPDIMPWHKTQLLNPEYTRVDLVKEGANSQAHIKLFKNKEGDSMKIEELLAKMKPEHASIVKTALDEAAALVPESTATQIANLEKAKKDAEDALAASNIAKSGENSEEEILKSITDPAIRTLLEMQIAKTKAAESAVRKAAEEKLAAEAVAKARELTVAGATEEQLVGIYKELSDKPEVRDNVFGILKAASAVADAGDIYQPVGKAGTQTEVSVGSADAAWDLIEKAAAVHKSSGMTQAAAITKAIEENPELYTKYIAG